MRELPKIYHDTKKRFNNNKEVFLSYSDKPLEINKTDIINKINNILNSKDFIYRTKVNILIDNELISKKIIGIRGDNLITIDNELIKIDKIKYIYK